MEVIENQSTLEELKQEAADLGLEVHPRIGAVRLQQQIDEKLKEISDAQKAKKEAKAESSSRPKVKIIVEHREGDDSKVVDQYFGFGSMATGVRENILIQFGEEIEVSEDMYEHIKSKGAYIKKFRLVPDTENGGQKKEWYDKWQSRFIVSKV